MCWWSLTTRGRRHAEKLKLPVQRRIKSINTCIGKFCNGIYVCRQTYRHHFKTEQTFFWASTFVFDLWPGCCLTNRFKCAVWKELHIMYFVNPQIALYGTQIIFNKTAGDISNHTNCISLESLPVTGCLLLVGDVVGFFLYAKRKSLFFFRY